MSDNIKKCNDGSYRWVYEFNMLKNPIIFLTVLKIFLLVLVGMWFVFGLFWSTYPSVSPEKNQTIDATKERKEGCRL